jgi:NADH dehydrogenase FAD-containing subunit
VERHAVRLDHPVAVRRAAERLAALGAGGRVVVVGGGLSGIETAAEIAERHPRLGVTLTTAGTIGGPYAPAGEAHLRGRLAALGVDLVEADPVELIERDRVSLRSGRTLPADLCIWAGGFIAPPLGREAGLETAADGRILVDETLRVPGRPEIFVAGDSAAVRNGNGGFIRMGCVSAAPLGAHAGANLRRQLDGSALEPFRFAFMLRCISLGRRDGLVQFTQHDDAPKAAVWTGRRAAATKELICAATFWAVKAEAGLGMPITWWPLGQAA